ncbi:MAG TPA: Glu/Leu/Phe/Val dehydrogenase dimerization domain-containing protein, partial [Acidimicrobiia bacterium]|nr:Glu/Leu/Phe/Val dehydrogenase dimerization domain-containing protein [Acidimicrobiia bacterium]
AAGGTRMKEYAAPAEALADATRLARAMTYKMAAAALPMGGGKSVLAVPGDLPDDHREQLLWRHGHNINLLGGNYRTGPDMNTSSADMDVLGQVTPFVFGRTPAEGGSGSSAPDTAVGCLHGIKASLAHVFGTDSLPGRRVLVQGVGEVGRRLAEMLAKEGATVLISDVDEGRTTTLAEELGLDVVPVGDELETECDVFAPCAAGGILTAATIPRLRCRIVAGAANNPLGDPADGARLQQAGILYAPDFVINGGGAIHLIGYETLGWSRAQVEAHLAGIGTTLSEIYQAAVNKGISTEEAAEQVAEARLAARPRPAGV